MDITQSLTCKCNGRLYPHDRALREHKKTKMHQTWEKENEVFDLRCRCKKLENEVECLKYDLGIYRNMCVQLRELCQVMPSFKDIFY